MMKDKSNNCFIEPMKEKYFYMIPINISVSCKNIVKYRGQCYSNPVVDSHLSHAPYEINQFTEPNSPVRRRTILREH